MNARVSEAKKLVNERFQRLQQVERDYDEIKKAHKNENIYDLKEYNDAMLAVLIAQTEHSEAMVLLEQTLLNEYGERTQAVAKSLQGL